MVGSGLKKLAAENNLKISHGVAYGSMREYAVTLSEGAGWKQVAFSTSFPDLAKKAQFMDLVSATDTQKEYRIQQLNISARNIVVVFHDNPGTMKRIQLFLNWFIPLLEEYGATKADICPECGMQVTGGSWKMVDGVAYYMHTACAERVRREITDGNEVRKQENTGSYGSGLVGALIGAVIGAVLWAIVLKMGFVASVVGLVIGFLAEKGYNLLHGKQGKGKVIILIAAIVVGVLLGTFGADVITVADMINNGELNLTYGEIPSALMTMLSENEEYASAMVSNILMGLLFAGIGVFALLRKTGMAVADTKFVDL